MEIFGLIGLFILVVVIIGLHIAGRDQWKPYSFDYSMRRKSAGKWESRPMTEEELKNYEDGRAW